VTAAAIVIVVTVANGKRKGHRRNAERGTSSSTAETRFGQCRRYGLGIPAATFELFTVQATSPSQSGQRGSRGHYS
jgi:hypothetical protein